MILQQETLLRKVVREAIENYFQALEGANTANLYELVLNEVECELINTVLNYTTGNQTQAAKLLSLSRGTLRKLIEKYKLQY